MARKDAVDAIRRQVYEKSGGRCRDCGAVIGWDFHMHEIVPRGNRGEISTTNSAAICAACHILRDGSAHGNRKPQFGGAK